MNYIKKFKRLIFIFIFSLDLLNNQNKMKKKNRKKNNNKMNNRKVKIYNLEPLDF